MEELAEFLRNYVDTENIREWLEHEPILTSEYIEEFLAKYYPDLAAQLILFLDIEIPAAYAAPSDQVYMYGEDSFTENSITVPFNGVEICVYDRDESTGNDTILFNGIYEACDITDSQGN